MATVLLVDDDIELVSMLREYLEQEGFDVTTAHDGEAGVRAALDGEQDIVVLDVMRPRVNGIEALRRIRAQIVERSFSRAIVRAARILLMILTYNELIEPIFM